MRLSLSFASAIAMVLLGTVNGRLARTAVIAAYAALDVAAKAAAGSGVAPAVAVEEAEE